MSAWRWRKKNPTMRWWECVPDRHRDEFQMQALASGEIPRFIESQKMKTCKNGGEEGRRGKVKCTHSPLESYLRFFPHSFFSYIFSSKSTHFSLALLLFFSFPSPCFASFSPPLIPNQSLLNPHLSSSRLQFSPHLLTLSESSGFYTGGEMVVPSCTT